MFDRKGIKAQAKERIRSAQVSPLKMTALLLVILLGLSLAETAVGGPTVQSMIQAGIFASFLSILVSLISMVLQGGYTLYCMGIRRSQQMGYAPLFDGFSMVGRLIAVFLLQALFIFLWSMLFVIPGIVATYRYSFAVYNLLEHPEISPLEAIAMSKAQTDGYKMDLFVLDLTFFGWEFLATLPYGIISGMTLAGYDLPPALLCTLVCGVLSGLVDVWRIPYYLFTHLEYFEIVKQHTGVGIPPQENALPPSNPDDERPLF